MRLTSDWLLPQHGCERLVQSQVWPRSHVSLPRASWRPRGLWWSYADSRSDSAAMRRPRPMTPSRAAASQSAWTGPATWSDPQSARHTHAPRRHSFKKLAQETCIKNLTQVRHSFLHNDDRLANRIARFVSHAAHFPCWNRAVHNCVQETCTRKKWPMHPSFWYKFLEPVSVALQIYTDVRITSSPAAHKARNKSKSNNPFIFTTYLLTAATTNRQTDRQTDTHTHRQTDRWQIYQFAVTNSCLMYHNTTFIYFYYWNLWSN